MPDTPSDAHAASARSRGAGPDVRMRRFSPGWRMTVFAVVLVPVVAGLGLWQLERAAEKRGYEETALTRLASLPVPAGEAMEAFRRVRLNGRYDAQRTFLVDNQVRDSVVGLGVVSVFVGDDGRRWLVNRGFVTGDPRRARLPEIATPAGR